jgi:hypothetical protein
MGSHQLVAATAERKDLEMRMRNLEQWAACECDPQIARILRQEEDILHGEWSRLQKRIDVESFESEPQA